jgi:lipid II:glycine glycyltransferase (peptidoglycan interpeptide bridge formation enzyme)
MMLGTGAFREIDLNAPESARAWDAFVDQSPQRMCFYKTAWIGGLNRHLGQNNVVIGAYEGKELIGGIALSQYGKFGVRGVRRPFATPYCNPIFHRSLDKDEVRGVTRELLRFLRSQYQIVSVTHSFQSCAVDDCAECAHVVRKKWTLVLKLNDLEEVWKHFHGELRNRIRKAQKERISVAQARATDDFYRLYDAMFKAQGRRVSFGREQFQRLCEQLRLEDVGRVYEARDAEGRLHAAALITLDARMAFYTLSGADPELRRSGANSLLLWEIFRDLSSPIRSFDMVGANLRTITRFKKQFGGALVEYPEHTYYASALMRLAEQSYDKLRSIKRLFL